MKVAFMTVSGHPNVGDEAILYSNIENYLAIDPNLVIYVHCMNAEHSRRVHTIAKHPTLNFDDKLFSLVLQEYFGDPADLTATRNNEDAVNIYYRTLGRLEGLGDKLCRQAFKALVDSLAGADVLHMTGGGFYGDTSMPVLIYVAIAVEMARKFKVPVLFSGVSAGSKPLHKLTPSILDVIFQSQDSISCRDNSLLRYFDSRQIPVWVGSDDVVACSDFGISTESEIKSRATYICVNLVSDLFPPPGISQDEKDFAFEQCVNCLLALYDLYPGVEIRLIEFSAESDLKVLERIAGALEAQNKPVRVWSVAFEHPINVSKLLSGASLNIGMRYHFTLFSYLSGANTVALAVNPWKLSTLIGSIGFPADRVVDLLSADAFQRILDLATSSTEPIDRATLDNHRRMARANQLFRIRFALQAPCCIHIRSIAECGISCPNREVS